MAEIVCEVGINHNGNLNTAIDLIHAAHEAGCRTVKFQLYNPRTLFADGMVMAQGRNWYEEVCKTEVPREWVKTLDSECKRLSMEFMASVFDRERIGWCEEVGVRRYKVASRSVCSDIVPDLIATGKPLIVSLGWWYTDVSNPVFPSIPNADFLYCVSEYPATNVNLDKVNFQRYAGFSDHSLGLDAAKWALLKGARIIEKHLTLDRRDTRGPDHACSCEPWELKELVKFAEGLP